MTEITPTHRKLTRETQYKKPKQTKNRYLTLLLGA